MTEGLAVDWRSDTLYWSDSDLQYIMAAKVTGHFHRKHVENTGHAEAIAVDSTLNRFITDLLWQFVSFHLNIAFHFLALFAHTHMYDLSYYKIVNFTTHLIIICA